MCIADNDSFFFKQKKPCLFTSTYGNVFVKHITRTHNSLVGWKSLLDICLQVAIGLKYT